MKRFIEIQEIYHLQKLSIVLIKNQDLIDHINGTIIIKIKISLILKEVMQESYQHFQNKTVNSVKLLNLVTSFKK
jgi:hypothetical protein